MRRLDFLAVPDRHDDPNLPADYLEVAPIPLASVPNSTGVGGHHWLTPNTVAAIKQLLRDKDEAPKEADPASQPVS